MRAIFAVFLFLVLGSVPAGAVQLSSFWEGDWEGGAYANDQTGAFSHCVATGEYESGIALFVSVNRYFSWSIGFFHNDWRLREGEKVPLQIRIDRSPWLDVEGTVLLSQYVEVPMPDDSTLVTLFRRGRVMEVRVVGYAGTIPFALTGTFRLLARLGNCVEQRLAMESGRSPTSPAVANNEPAVPSAPESGISTGTGIVVSTDGHVVTNAHVVDGCAKVVVRRPGDVMDIADVVVDDAKNDLALLKSNLNLNESEVGRLAAGRSPPTGERIAVYGFPLAGALSSTGNFVEGIITSAAGLADDINHFQISAPIQPGNSGGPLLDTGGRIVGVVNARLNDLAWASETGAIPQNVNFAIKGNVLANFLEAHSVPYLSEPRGETLTLVQIAERAKKFTVLVVCAN